MDQEYVQGFMDKCAACGVDPIKLAQNVGTLDTAQNLLIPGTPRSLGQADARPTKPPVENKANALKGSKTQQPR